jgi:hypothetical protein
MRHSLVIIHLILSLGRKKLTLTKKQQKAMDKYNEMKELHKADIVEVSAILKKMVEAQSKSGKAPKRLIVSPSMYMAAQKIALQGNPQKHEIEVDFDK